MLLACNLPANQGSYSWDVTSLSAGTYYVYATVQDAAGNSQSRFSTGPVRVRGGYMPLTDNDRDGMADAWEARYAVSSPSADDDGDGVSNLQEYQNGTDPRLSNRWVLPEGSTGFFTERLALANPNPEDATVNIDFLREQGDPVTRSYTVPGNGRLSVDVNSVVSGAVSAVVDTVAGGVVVERTMFWGDQSYGGHTGKAMQASRTQWYLAEGNAGFFDTYILLANPGDVTANVDVDYLLDDGSAPVRRDYSVPPRSRYTIDTKQVPGLSGRSFSSSIASDQPINVERSMYFSNQGRFWTGGHEAAAVDAPATSWFVAEGRTGRDVRHLPAAGQPGHAGGDGDRPLPASRRRARSRRRYRIGPQSRFTEYVDAVPGLEDTDVSASITATGPIIVERAMYWPGPATQWREAHASAGVTTTGTKWLMAEGEYGGPLAFDTYILVANPSDSAANVTVSLLRTSGQPPATYTATVPANSRFTLSAGQFAINSGDKFGILVESTNGTPIVVERAMYWNGGGEFWGGGTNETAVRLR